MTPRIPEDGIPPGFIALSAALYLVFTFLSGCTTLGQSRVTSHFEETVAPDGTATTLFKADSRGDVDASLHKMDYKWGGEENQIIVGQDSSGVTSPAQQQFIQGLAALIANIPGMWESLMGAVTRPVPVPTPEASAP